MKKYLAILAMTAGYAAGAETATATITTTQIDATHYHYTVVLNNTGTTTLGTFWFAWTPNQDYMPVAPTNVQSPANWTSQITGSGSPNDGYAVLWTAQSGGLLAPGASLSGFSFDSTATPAQISGASQFFNRPPVATAVVYSGVPFSDGGYTLVANLTTSTTPTALRFVALTPCRVMETRFQYNFEGRTGAFGPPTLAAGETRTLNLPQSNVCTVPSIAKAYVLNVTLIPTSATPTTVTVWSASDTRPNTPAVRSGDGQIVANSAIVTAGTNGGINVSTSAPADVLIDISGYFTDSTTVPGLAFYPITPCRVIDTRSQYRLPPGPFGPGSMTARETRKFRFPASPYCSVPAAAAYSVTLTAVPPASLAYLTAWADGGAQPNVSSINSFAGRTLANNVIIPAAADGSIDVFAFDATDIIIDVNGYFAPDDGQNGLFYFPVTQCRASDSTLGTPYPDDTARTINIPASGCAGIPSTAKAYAINVTALPNGSPMPFITAYPTGQPRPNASILNAFQGQMVSNSAIIPAGTNGAIDVYAFRRTDVQVDVSGYFSR